MEDAKNKVLSNYQPTKTLEWVKSLGEGVGYVCCGNEEKHYFHVHGLRYHYRYFIKTKQKVTYIFAECGLVEISWEKIEIKDAIEQMAKGKWV